MKKSILFFLFFTAIFQFTYAQSSTPKHKIALFAPLYLDSAFTANDEYRYEKNTFPKFINPGLEFYEGAQLAFDSLNKTGAPLEVFIYDTRSGGKTIPQLLADPAIQDVELILAFCSSAEVRPFADAGLQRNIPVINVNMPNNGGVTGNPFFVILNSTLQTQCEGIYQYMQQYYAKQPIVVFRKKGKLEDRLKLYFDEYGKSTQTAPLKLKYIDLTDSFDSQQLKTHLDTLNQYLCVAGSLDENFGKRLAMQLASLNKQSYRLSVLGMPTWDAIKDFSNPEYKGIEIIYSTPFYNARTDSVSQKIIEYFNTNLYARPSDMVMRGYETVWRFANLLLQYKTDFASNLTRKEFNILKEFDIQPVINKQNMQLEYFENKKLFFIKWQDGLIKSVK